MMRSWPVLVLLLACWCAGVGFLITAVRSRGDLLAAVREARQQGRKALRRLEVALVVGGCGLLSVVMVAGLVVTAVKLLLRHLD